MIKTIEELTNKIILGDCLEVMKEIPDESVDLVLTDPPYGENIGSMNFIKSGSIKSGVALRTDFKNHETDWDKSSITEEQLKEIFRISKNQIIFGANNFANILPNSRCWIVWDKRGSDKFSNDFADFEIAWTSFDKPSRIIRYLWSGMLQEDMRNKEKRLHPTQKPLKVIKKLIEMFSNKNTIVLDPFLGSGTTAVAAKILERNFIGIEKNPEYVKMAEERLKPFLEQKKLGEMI